MKKDNRMKNLAYVAELLRQDETMQKLGLGNESQLQKKIDGAIKKIDQGLLDVGPYLVHKAEK